MEELVHTVDEHKETSKPNLEVESNIPNSDLLKNFAKKTLKVTAAVSAAPATQAWAQVAVQPTQAVPFCDTLAGSPTAAHRLAHKASFGYWSGLEQEITNMGYNNWLNQQLDPPSVPGWSAYEAALATTYPTIIAPVGDPTFCDAPVAGNRQELVKARIHRAVESPAQLYERVVEFWTDHLNTFHFAPNLDNMKTFEDRDDIRANALGKLHELIKASATSPAMLIYLDGDSNVDTNPNENYARELLELHTLGVDNCYDETTIQGLSLALTGWEVTKGTNCGIVSFNNNNHDNNAKTIPFHGCATLNIPINSGIGEIDLVIDHLTNPAFLGEKTVRYIARKMAEYFWGCHPPRWLITQMWEAYETAFNAGNNDISAMISTMLSKNWIHCSKPILKRPLHLLASTLRGTGVTVSDPGTEFQSNSLVGGFLTATGHRPYAWPAPNGYPNGCDEEYWGINQLQRWNLGANIFDVSFPLIGINAIPTMQAALAAATDQELMDLIDSVAFGGFMDPFDKSRILTYLANSTYTFARIDALALSVAAPSFQWF